MKPKDYDLNLAPTNKIVNKPIIFNTMIESYYHMGQHNKIYDIDKTKFLLFLHDFSILRKPEYLQKIHTVTSDEIGRIDTISYKYYKSPELWWLLAEVNYIDPFELYEGQELLIPNLREFDFISMQRDTFAMRNEDRF